MPRIAGISEPWVILQLPQIFGPQHSKEPDGGAYINYRAIRAWLLLHVLVLGW